MTLGTKAIIIEIVAIITMIGFYLGNSQLATTMVAFITMIAIITMVATIMEANEKVTLNCNNSNNSNHCHGNDHR
jgi:hypothetical protein